MSAVALAGVAFGAVVAYMTVIWLVSVRLRNASIVDIFWGPGFLLVALAYLAFADGYDVRRVLVTALVAAWGLRLGTHIFLRNRGHEEDFRYVRWRKAAGPSFWWQSYFRVFLLQGVLLWVISAPLLAAQANTQPDHIIVTDVAGVIIWAVGLFFEAVGDWQLTRFKADPANKGKVMDRGLWALTRHPNYFGDATAWWGLYVIAAGTALGFVTIFAPALMTFMLLRVSGVALLEKGMEKRRPGYAEYIQGTSAFLPWFPRRRAG